LAAFLAARDPESGTNLINSLGVSLQLPFDHPNSGFDRSLFTINTGSTKRRQFLQANIDLDIYKIQTANDPDKKHLCPALRVRPSGSQENLLMLVWENMATIAEEHHYQGVNPPVYYPALYVGKFSIRASRIMGPHSVLPKAT